MNNSSSKLIIGFFTGIAVILIINHFYLSEQINVAAENSNNKVKKPLYWVAPMDANYRRDKPGKSPMGMDLVPFYGIEGGSDEIGSIRISADVVNNLGVKTAKVLIKPMKVIIGNKEFNMFTQELKDGLKSYMSKLWEIG